jgi:hypothetical protein
MVSYKKTKIIPYLNKRGSLAGREFKHPDRVSFYTNYSGPFKDS